MWCDAGLETQRACKRWLFQLLVPMVFSSILKRALVFFDWELVGGASRFQHARAMRRGPANLEKFTQAADQPAGPLWLFKFGKQLTFLSLPQAVINPTPKGIKEGVRLPYDEVVSKYNN